MDWDEAQATRDDRLTSTAWGAQYGAIDGSDATASLESTVLFQEGETGNWKSWNLTNVTQEWVTGDSSNYGVILWATNEDTDGYDLRFRHSEYTTDTSKRPKLEVTYTEDPLKTVFFLKDHLGSIRATVEEDGDVVGYTDYDPWGYVLANRALETGWSGQNVAQNKFTGKEWDDDYDLNWFHFGARYYDPEIGRWVAIDPLTEKHPDWSPYNYVLDNPLILIDPDGRQVHFGFAQAVAVADGADPNEILAAQNQGALQGAKEGILTSIELASDTFGDAFEFITGSTVTLREGDRLSAGISLLIPGISSKTLKGGQEVVKVVFTKAGNIDKRTKLGRELAKQQKNLIAETKDVTSEFTQIRKSLEQSEKLAGSKEAADLLSAFEVISKSQNIKQGTKSFFQKIVDFFKKKEE